MFKSHDIVFLFSLCICMFIRVNFYTPEHGVKLVTNHFRELFTLLRAFLLFYNEKGFGKKHSKKCKRIYYKLAWRGFDPRTSGVRAQHASAAPLCSLLQCLIFGRIL